MKKLLIGSITVVLVTFLTVCVVFVGFIEKNAIADKTKELKASVNRITEISRVAFLNKSTHMDFIYNTMIDNIAYNTNISIIIFDTNGNIVTVSGLNKSDYNGKKLEDKYFKKVLNGNEFVQTGLLDSLYGEDTLTVGAPMISDGITIGGVFLTQSISELKSVSYDLFSELFIFLLAAMIFSFILFYVVSRQISIPIKRIDEAVGEFTKGNFSKRVEYKSNNELGRLAENFNEMATSLENLENSRTTFISDVSHELRTPMTTISGFVEGILDGTIERENEDKYLSIVLSESKRLSRLVDNLLKISRMEKNNVPLKKEKFDINELIRLVIIRFENQINAKHIDVDLILSDDRCTVFADKDNINQVLVNLFNNAVKFTEDGGYIKIRVWVHQKKCYVEIKNSGHGIEKENLNRIFERFYKTDRSRSEDKTGVGLGLYIVKKIIDKHGEKIWAASVPDSYTSFTFSLAHVKGDKELNDN